MKIIRIKVKQINVTLTHQYSVYVSLSILALKIAK